MERKYQMIRVKAGDYLLPANDGKTIWRIMSYEDGPTHGLDWPRDRTVWGAWRWKGTFDELGAVDPESDEWSPWDGRRWEARGGWFDTRREAIDYALEATQKAGEETLRAHYANGGKGIGSVLIET